MVRLSDKQFEATCTNPMIRVGSDEAPPFDFWPYFWTIPTVDFQGHDCSAGEVAYAWRTSDAQYEHVLVNSTTKNVFMVLVLNRPLKQVHGHYLLDLNEKYGLNQPNP